MNINLRLKIPLVNETDPLDTLIYNVDTNLMLNPLYALEIDILNPFDEIIEEKLHWVRKVLFNASLTVYRLTRLIESSGLMNPTELALMRRDFTICIAVNETGKQLYKDTAVELQRSKSLGDFSVMTRKKNDLGLINKIISDSSGCIDEMKKLIEDIELSNVKPKSFVKGSQNESTLTVGRLWWLSDLEPTTNDGYASKKHLNKGRWWKAGELNSKSGG